MYTLQHTLIFQNPRVQINFRIREIENYSKSKRNFIFKISSYETGRITFGDQRDNTERWNLAYS